MIRDAVYVWALWEQAQFFVLAFLPQEKLLWTSGNFRQEKKSKS